MNWYVLFALRTRSAKIIRNLNKNQELDAFMPMYEVCHRRTKEVTVRPMFPDYIFVKTDLAQEDFNQLLYQMREENSGLIKQLLNSETSALREDEILFFHQVLDERHIVRLSHGYLAEDGIHIVDGPLRLYQEHIVKLDKHNQCVYLDLVFFDRRIIMGLDI